MNRTLLALASAAVLVLLSCHKDEELPTAEYWPLAEGNQWETSEEYSWEVPMVGSDTSTSQTSNTVEALTERDDGKKVWPVATTTTEEDSTVYSRTFYHVTEDSVYIYSMDKNAEPTAVEPTKLEIGTEWNGNLAIPVEIPSVSTDFPAHFEVVAEEQVEVPAGTFQCLKIQIDLTEPEAEEAAYQWRAEGTGIVKMTADIQTEYLGFTVSIEGTSQMESKSGF